MELGGSVVNNDDTTALSTELDAVSSESRELLLLANDNEQFTRNTACIIRAMSNASMKAEISDNVLQVVLCSEMLS